MKHHQIMKRCVYIYSHGLHPTSDGNVRAMACNNLLLYLMLFCPHSPCCIRCGLEKSRLCCSMLLCDPVAFTKTVALCGGRPWHLQQLKAALDGKSENQSLRTAACLQPPHPVNHQKTTYRIVLRGNITNSAPYKQNQILAAGLSRIAISVSTTAATATSPSPQHQPHQEEE